MQLSKIEEIIPALILLARYLDTQIQCIYEPLNFSINSGILQGARISQVGSRA